nr:hypothetical protein [Rubrimonas cliftonensis]
MRAEVRIGEIAVFRREVGEVGAPEAQVGGRPSARGRGVGPADADEDRKVEDRGIDVDVGEADVGHVGAGEVGPNDPRAFEIGLDQLGAAEAGVGKIGLRQAGHRQIRVVEDRSAQVGAVDAVAEQGGHHEFGADKVRVLEVDPGRRHFGHVGLAQVRPAEVHIAEGGHLEVRGAKGGRPEIRPRGVHARPDRTFEVDALQARADEAYIGQACLLESRAVPVAPVEVAPREVPAGKVDDRHVFSFPGSAPRRSGGRARRSRLGTW